MCRMRQVKNEGGIEGAGWVESEPARDDLTVKFTISGRRA